MEQEQRIGRDFYLKFGLLLGIVSIAYSLVAYLAGVDFMAGFANMGLAFLVAIGTIVFIGITARRQNGGYLTFKEAFKTLALVVLLGQFLATLFDYTLNTVIDPDLPKEVVRAATDKTLDMMEGFGMDDAELDEIYEEMEARIEEADDQYTFGNFFFSFGLGYLFMLVPALIVALVIKRDPSPLNTVDS